MNDDVKNINNILSLVINDIQGGKEKIFNIAESLKNQHKKYEKELLEVEADITTIIKEIDRLEKLDKDMRKKLAYASVNFQQDEDIVKAIYEEALNIRVEYITKQKEERRLELKKYTIQKNIKENEKNIEEAETVVEQVSVALNYLNGEVFNTIEEEDQKKRMAYSIRFVKAQEKERNRISRDIHDGPAQYLASTLMRLDFCKMLLKNDLDEGLKELEDVKGNVKKTLKEIRGIIFDLKPPFLNGVTLNAAIDDLKEAFQEESDMDLNVKVKSSDLIVDYVLEVSTYRIIQEILNNMIKHSDGKSATLRLEVGAEDIYINAKDDGKGFNVDEVLRNIKNSNKKYGIAGIYDRVEELGGELKIISNLNKGTEYKIKLPIKSKET